MTEQEEFHFVAGFYMVSPKNGKTEKEIRDYLISHKRFSDEQKCHICTERTRTTTTPDGVIPINSRMIMCLN